MQFKNPEILYFLFLLIIPILVHLFQLNKFKKITFTNVAFLKQIQLQNRKSSQLKKWLILATRMLLLLAIIFAFAQPFFSSKNLNSKQHNFIYLDNSFSTNSNGKKGDLLQIAAQNIIENSSENENYTLATNTDFYDNISASALKNKLLGVQNFGKSANYNTILLQFNALTSTKTKSLNNVILISDFQYNEENYLTEFTNVNQPFSAVQLKSEVKNNLAIDSVFINPKNEQNITLNVVIKNQGESKNNIPIALLNNQKLVSKLSFSIEKNSEQIIEFLLPKSAEIKGEIQLNFKDTFSFDNSFYFVANSNQKINILSIGKTSKFLPKIYSENEFNFNQNSAESINYNSLKNQQLIILNELEKIPTTLADQIVDFSKNAGYVIVIPNENADFNSYNDFFSKLNLGSIIQKNTDSLKITSINFNHPLLENVFLKKVTNFQYPFTKINFSTSLAGSTILDFENQTAFTKEINTLNSKIYWFSSPLNSKSSNFQNSPLIVPVFYNIGLKSVQSGDLFYTTDKKNLIDVAVSLQKNAVLSITNKNKNFIPLQQQFQNKVSISMTDEILEAGFYYVKNQNDTLKTIAFNYPKSESDLNFYDMEAIANKNPNIAFFNSTDSLLKSIHKKNEVHWVWKWFLIVAIVSLLLEILILKFFKP